MKTEDEIRAFRGELVLQYPNDDDRVEHYTACFASSIPRLFWDVSSKDIKSNKALFKKVAMGYTKKWRMAYRNGYGLLLTGDNGVGKTIWMSFILTQMIKRGRSVYFTSLSQLDVDLKKGFKDRAYEKALEDKLSSDFVAIDELGKEHQKAESYLMSRLELLMKTRYDDGDPMLLASNSDYEHLCQYYGSSIASMLEGKYTHIALIGKDFRKKQRAQMTERMGFE